MTSGPDLEARLSPKTVDPVKGFDRVCAFVNDTIDENVLHILKRENIGVVAMRCAGYNNVDLKAAYKGVHILRVPANSPFAVAEHAMALILTLNHRTHKSYLRTREGNFARREGFTYLDLRGLYSKSDSISLHCPLTKETHHLIDETALAHIAETTLDNFRAYL